VEEIQWLLTNAERITVGGLLAFALFALYRGWIVLGSTYKECRDTNTRLEAEVAAYIEEDKREKEDLRHELAELRTSLPRRRQAP
jgi:hypothetical protein